MVAATTVSSTNAHALIASPDLDHVENVASDCIIESWRFTVFRVR